MYKILLVCNAGMSTSMLVQRMEKAAASDGIEVKITAMPITAALKELDDWDVVMLGPQVRHELKKLKDATTTPIEVIEMRDYGMMNGENVLKAAMKIIDAK
ncbi:PTS sugar transporter subunit IIB [Thomasclavelia sp.]|uniref:PTS sugar transporter subunit IIB n=1 Tax=Thomasclavelia sp. TaxID=3025757 RepID=UPI0025E665DA|nr:PTS sugar transporter subunit IIB [Thomasclavelia sp.]